LLGTKKVKAVKMMKCDKVEAAADFRAGRVIESSPRDHTS